MVKSPANDDFYSQLKMPEAVSEISYEATYTQRLDEKRRVPVPHRWRSGKTEDFHVTIWPKHKAGTCLLVLPPAQMKKFREKLDAIPDGSPHKAVLKRQIASRTITVKVDNAGRIALPEEMTNEAEIKTEAVFVGMFDRFEIWSAQRYSQAKSMDKAMLNEALQMME